MLIRERDQRIEIMREAYRAGLGAVIEEYQPQSCMGRVIADSVVVEQHSDLRGDARCAAAD